MFYGLCLDRVGTGYTLPPAATGLTTGSSTVFNVTPGTASRLVFTVQPTTTVAGATITPAVQVTAQDAHGNTATRSEEHTSELQSHSDLVCRLLLEKKKQTSA